MRASTKWRARSRLRSIRRACPRLSATLLIALSVLSLALVVTLLYLRGFPAFLPSYLSSTAPAAASEKRSETVSSASASVATETSARHSPRRPRVYISDLGERHRDALSACVSSRLSPAARTSSFGNLSAVRDLGVTSSSNDCGLDVLLLRKFGAYSQRTRNISDADFFFFSLPFTMIIDCMRASNDEERRDGVPRSRRVYPKLAMHYTNLVYADLVNSEEYALAMRKSYPSILVAHTEYSRELAILTAASPFSAHVSNTVLRITAEIPRKCASGASYLQVPYPAHVGVKHDDVEKLVAAVEMNWNTRGKLAYYAGSCTKTAAHIALCNGMSSASDVEVVPVSKLSPLESVAEQPEEHYAAMANTRFCPHPGARARTRREFYNAALLGCIPVLFRHHADAYERLLRPAVEVGNFAIVLEKADESVPANLRSVAQSRVETVRKNLYAVMPRLRYAERHDEEDDAFAAILDNLAMAMKTPEKFSCEGDQ